MKVEFYEGILTITYDDVDAMNLTFEEVCAYVCWIAE